MLLPALRNTLRHRGRLLLGTCVIGIASLLLVFASAPIAGVKRALARMTDGLTGHIQIKPKPAGRSFFVVSSGGRLELPCA